MPFLDVSDLLSDPDLADQLTCTRQVQTVGSNGMASNTQTNISFTGVVTSNEGNVLDVIAEGERIKGSITVHTTFGLRDGGSGNAPDIVTWNGKEYYVDTIKDYSRFGAGFVAADCQLKPLSG